MRTALRAGLRGGSSLGQRPATLFILIVFDSCRREGNSIQVPSPSYLLSLAYAGEVTVDVYLTLRGDLKILRNSVGKKEGLVGYLKMIHPHHPLASHSLRITRARLRRRYRMAKAGAGFRDLMVSRSRCIFRSLQKEVRAFTE